MKTIIWRVRCKSAPTAARYCKRCGVKTPFIPSGLFRVNANQKALDIWLIYRCRHCDTTWNLTLFSRASPRALPPDLLQGFLDNDGDLALRYALDAALIKRNGAEPGLPDYEVTGESADLSEPVQIRLRAEQPSEWKAEAVLRKELGMSRSVFDRRYERGEIKCLSGQDLKKCRLDGEIIIQIGGSSPQKADA